MQSKVFITSISLFLFACMAFSLQAQVEQLSKSEEKKWKDQAKEYKKNPAALKALVDEKETLRRENLELEDRLDLAESEVEQKDEVIAQLRREVASLNDEIESVTSMLDDEPTTPVQPDTDFEIDQGQEMLDGVVFKVQIGAYAERRIDEDLDTSADFGLEDQGGLQKIVIGQFRDIYKAEQLRDNLIAMGLKDAWVVAYRDGRRISVKEALGG